MVQQIWYWLGKNSLYFREWRSLQSILHFAMSLGPSDRTAFLIVFSATCWTLWKHRNEICFHNIAPKTARTLIYLIISLVLYWTGHSKFKKKIQDQIFEWLPQVAILEEIPLRVIWPGDDESVSFHMVQADADRGAESSAESTSYAS